MILLDNRDDFESVFFDEIAVSQQNDRRLDDAFFFR